MLSMNRGGLFGALSATSSVISNVFTKNTALPRAALPVTTVRYASNFSPRRTKYRKSQKGKIPLPTGGSTKGTTVEFGDFGLRIKEGARLTARQLTAVHNTVRRKIKPVKGSQMWMRVFPDIPVTSKGNEVRMGKGKGTFDYWACRVPLNRIIFEISGMRKEIAKEAFRLASHKLPVKTEFVERGAKSVVGAGYVAPAPASPKTDEPSSSSSQ
ncbi:ribosomal protein L16p/L10e-domain-containing protein [Radiomyces spectabilis]|uniref:ribosomal protein L16p/L10e-domain-containing protein n=1 Tax=Radiomyces spectabilis TaxID=64574 RepID=UPI00221E6C44|nr:ribosomal protein L16p/L10e-domain-containing protein [Radiomyces spectabilis]KAI8376057.1 ribosomal protein L16p/L10e-domain-containing protein [Radiomyces spectabilis]